MDVAIIDYKMSNLHSVKAACRSVGLSSVITSDACQILDAKIAVLPGVGAFGEAMKHLNDLKLDDCIHRFVETGRPFIGICLGLQLLFETSEEFGSFSGLGLVRGAVRKFQCSERGKIKYPVPQVGWNTICQGEIAWKDTLLDDNCNSDFMYFVHSFYVLPAEENVILSKTKYGNHEFCSSVQKKNIFGSQFHPEKSGVTGMKIYNQLKKTITG